MAKKKLYFYEVKLLLEDKEVDFCKLKKVLTDIFDRCSKNGALSLNEVGQERITLDIVENTETYLFCRIGKEKENNTMVLREYDNLEKEDVLSPEEAEKKSVEMTTYFYLNYRSGILAFVSNQSAPKVESLELIMKLYAEEYKLNLLSILNDGYIKRLFQKGAELSKIELEIPIPHISCLEEILGIDEKTLQRAAKDEEQGLDVRRVSLVLQGPKKGVLTDDEKLIEKVVGRIKSSTSFLQKAKVYGKTKIIKMQEFNLMEQFFSYDIDIQSSKKVNGRKIGYTVDELTQIYKDKIRDAYFQNKDMLLVLTNRYERECDN